MTFKIDFENQILALLHEKKDTPQKGLGDQFSDFHDYIQLRFLFCFWTYVFYKISNFDAEIQVFEGMFLKLS